MISSISTFSYSTYLPGLIRSFLEGGFVREDHFTADSEEIVRKPAMRADRVSDHDDQIQGGRVLRAVNINMSDMRLVSRVFTLRGGCEFPGTANSSPGSPPLLLLPSASPPPPLLSSSSRPPPRLHIQTNCSPFWGIRTLL